MTTFNDTIGERQAAFLRAEFATDGPPFVFDDGGREAAGYRGTTGDCAVRAIAITTGHPYQQVYDGINAASALERPRNRRRSNARTGVWPKAITRYLEPHGWMWVPTMTVGAGTTVHVRADELPGGPLVLRLSKHYAAMLDGVVHDLDDPSRGGTRAVYGYWMPA